ncbi:helix-hairpin-helix domain-containing protein [Streptomyces sp. SCUT-3]|uniref:helix-hairpin-helix domain-containing protein n=1 Tax=Streptomyces sp. SCUT-3 TaxID=2684469 RepID=UPI002175574D|nr:helix-hairpin-helix domain-containing protein [Streptomyces sp. SCUT-3]
MSTDRTDRDAATGGPGGHAGGPAPGGDAPAAPGAAPHAAADPGTAAPDAAAPGNTAPGGPARAARRRPAQVAPPSDPAQLLAAVRAVERGERPAFVRDMGTSAITAELGPAAAAEAARRAAAENGDAGPAENGEEAENAAADTAGAPPEETEETGTAQEPQEPQEEPTQEPEEEPGHRPDTGTGTDPAAGPGTAAHRPQPAPPARPAPAPAAPDAVPRPVRRTEDEEAARREAVRGAAALLARGGAPEALGGPAVDALGERAATVLEEDPWHLLSVPEVRPEQADAFARALLGADCRPDDPRRAHALVVWLLEQAALAGHTALEAPALLDALRRRSVPEPDEALRAALENGRVLAFRELLEATGPASGRPARSASGGDGGEEDEEEPPTRLLVGLDRYALAEESLADGLLRLLNTHEPDPGPWEEAASAAGTPSASELLRAVGGSGVVLHTGGDAARAEPVAVVAAARAAGLRAWAAAATGDSRRRLAALLSAAGADAGAAVTAGGLLSGHEGPGRDEDGNLALDVLVVVDAPQWDVETAATLVESVPDGAHLVFSGDPALLASVGAGRVFADLLASGVCPQVASRTPDPGPIGELVSGIGIGELNQVEAPGREVVIVPVRDAGEAVHRTVQLVADSVPRAFGVEPGRTRVVTPGHGGAAGTRVLNAALKARLNPGPGRFGGFDPGDLAVYVPAPGRTLPGTVVSGDADGLHLDCDGHEVVVPREQAGRVRHGWAVTAHQAAGMRWPAVVVVLPGDAVRALDRAWVYTAFGRGERHLSVVHGADRALEHAVAQVPARPRTTRLRTVLREQAGHLY